MPEKKDDVVEVEPSAVTPAVAADIKSDAEGEPRSKEGSLPPPGTERPSFWQAQATKQALVTTIGLVLFTAYAGVDYLFTGRFMISADAVKVELGLFVWAWAAAFGIHSTDADALRWK